MGASETSKFVLLGRYFMKLDRLDQAADQFLAAYLGGSAWEDALSELSRATGCIGANLMPVTTEVPGPIIHTENITDLGKYYFKNEIYKRCIRQRGFPLLVRRGIAVDHDYASDGDIARDPYYREFLEPFGLRWGAMIGFRVGEEDWACLLHRSVDAQPFGYEEKNILLRLRSHMTLAGTIGANVASGRIENMSEAMDLANVACIFFNRQGRIFRANAKAETLLCDGIGLSQGELITLQSKETVEIRRRLRPILYGSPIAEEDAQGPLLLSRQSKRPLVLDIQRVQGTALDIFPAASAIGLIRDTAGRVDPKMDALRQLFGLTPMEAKICVSLVQGDSLHQIATSLDISYNTVRSHTKNVFSKTDTRRQGELIALISKILN